MRRGKFKDEGFIFRHPQDRRSGSFFYVTKKNFEKYKRDIDIYVI